MQQIYSSSELVLEAKDLCKRIGGQTLIKGVSLNMYRGCVLGLLGGNGAGKSTTMRILAGIMEPEEGELRFMGQPYTCDRKDLRRHVGYLADTNPLYADMYVREYLFFALGLYGISGREAAARIEEVMQLTGLESEQGKRIRVLSKGYKQRVGIAQAILHDPDLLILDEPTSGLDPNQLVEVRALIRELGETRALILSTHLLNEVEAICDEVAVLHRGQLIYQDQIQNLPSQGGLEHVFVTMTRV